MTDLRPAAPPAPPASVLAPPPPSSGRRTPARPCTNCGDATVGNFCPVCGQRKVEVRVSTRRMLLEALDDQFSLNSALPRTLVSLLFRPGHLTREYVDGRVVRYIPPFRLYLFCSLLFFLTLSQMPGVRNLGGVVDIRGTPEAVDSVADVVRPPGEHWTDNIKLRTSIPEVDRRFEAQLERLRKMPPGEAFSELGSAYLGRVPTMMIAFLPVFAAVLKLLYARRRRFYVEHFVFALHVHAFAFVTGTAMLVLRVPAVESVLSLWLFLYIYLAMKRFYRQGWIKTGLKYATLGTAYNVMLMIALMIGLVVTLLLL